MTALDDPSGVLDATIEGLSEIAAAWRSQRAERLGRTALDRSDFDAIAKTGYVLSMVPVDEGATWIDAARSVRPISITGVKHFGSGMGITDWMITTARPDGSDDPAIFFFPVSDVPWDGSAGLTLTAPWDGVGMAATQSHGMKLDRVIAVRYEHDASIPEIGLRASPFNLTNSGTGRLSRRSRARWRRWSRTTRKRRPMARCGERSRSPSWPRTSCRIWPGRLAVVRSPEGRRSPAGRTMSGPSDSCVHRGVSPTINSTRPPGSADSCRLGRAR